MRSFRFSRFAMVSMILALIGVRIAIEIARRQSASEFIAETGMGHFFTKP